MLKIILSHGTKARAKILKGASLVGDIVGASLGPRGRNAIIKTKYSAPQILNDGVTIARNLMLDDELEDLGAQTLIDGSMKADDRAGDGTTTTVVLSAKIVEEYAKRIKEEDEAHSGVGTVGTGGESTADVNRMAKEILDTGKLVVEKLNQSARPLGDTELKNVISSSLGVIFPEFVDSLAQTVDAVGKDGYISVEDNWHTKYGIETELIKGMRFNGTYATPYMINSSRKEAIQEDVLVFICNHDIATTTQLQTLLKEVVQKGIRKLVIIANKFETPFVKLMASTVALARTGDTRLVDYLCIKAPSLTTEQMIDVATFCGAKFFDKNRTDIDLSKADGFSLGFVKKVVVDENEVIMIDGRGMEKTSVALNKKEKLESAISPLEERIALLKTQIEDEKDPAFKEQTKRRLGALQSGFAVIRVGAATEGERIIIKKKIEDAVHSAQNALEEGVVKGGGLALKEIADELGEKHPMYIPLRAPYDRIQASAGGQLEIPDSVIDPLKVVRIAIETACSVAASLVTVEIGIAERRKTLWDELDRKLDPQHEAEDDFREDANQEQKFR